MLVIANYLVCDTGIQDISIVLDLAISSAGKTMADRERLLTMQLAQPGLVINYRARTVTHQEF